MTTQNNVATKKTVPVTPTPAKVSFELPAGVTPEMLNKAMKFYKTRMDYQETHNKARRLAMTALSHKYNAEYKAFYNAELAKMGITVK